MHARAPVLLLALLLGACNPSKPPSTADLATAPVEIITDGLVGAVELDMERDAPPAVVQPAVYVEPWCDVPDAAIDLIIAFEVGSPEIYTARYRHPVWPGAASGATIGIGYDLGHRAPNVIAIDWERHPHHLRLVTASGVTGVLARDVVRKLADISVEYGYARAVFDQTSVVEHLRLARRAFGEDEFCAAPPAVRGALLSVVFNRGASMTGAARAELRAIRDTCLRARDWACVAFNIRAMTRIWRGTAIERGMQRRREAEARLIEVAA